MARHAVEKEIYFRSCHALFIPFRAEFYATKLSYFVCNCFHSHKFPSRNIISSLKWQIKDKTVFFSDVFKNVAYLE
jgi:hypothetical protein